MYKYSITAPNKDYSGAGFGMVFARGQSSTDDERIARMLKAKGYTVEGLDDDDGFPPMLLTKESLEQLDPAQLQDYAAAHRVDIGRTSTPKSMIDKIVEAGAIAVVGDPGTPEA